MKRSSTAVLPLLLLGAVLTAQVPEVPPQQNDRVTRRAQEMRDNLGKGTQVKSHVRVQVRLKNGNRLKGVVKDGRLVERVNGLRFVDADASDRGAGIRLWYSGGTRNYVFVPFKGLAEYKVLQRLSPKELLAIETQLKMEEVKRLELARQEMKMRKQKDEAEAAAAAALAAAQPAGETQNEGVIPPMAKGKLQVGAVPGKNPAQSGAGAGTGATGTTGATKTGAAGDAGAQAEMAKLLQMVKDYPPQSGWCKAKADEIKRRFVVIGARPSEKEQFFADNYDLWVKACGQFGLDTEQSQPAPETGQGGEKKK